MMIFVTQPERLQGSITNLTQLDPLNLVVSRPLETKKEKTRNRKDKG